MFKKVLIANRGEIAARIIRSLKKLNIKSVAIFSEADRHAPYVLEADEAYLVGPAPVSESYLNIPKIIEIAKSTHAEAVHPGYGLLSENPNFIEALTEAKVQFIGPTIEQLQSFGLKDKARDLAKKASVPLMPGTDLIDNVEQSLVEAEKIGYPIMLKAAAGGGGIGMQRCENKEELKVTYESVTNLAKNNFGNANVFIEKCIDRARHIEVQIFGDGQGNVLTIGERDCSLQRRNQKVVEETPAPNLSDEIRASMNTSAVSLAAQHNYKSAGTVEYIYDCDNDAYYFLEVNTRLQVEHTVTEEIFDIDLVEWMIRLEAGDTSFWPKETLTPKGHAIQARIYAEDPVRNFQPCTGEISHWDFVGAPRLESAVDVGSQVTPYYDPLLAKVILKGEDRKTALNKLHNTLSQSTIGGVQTNMSWIAGLLTTPEFQAGEITTKYIEYHKKFPSVFEVLRAGIQTTVQDYPGRLSMWNVGVPPSGPMDMFSFQLGNQLLQNESDAAGLECLLHGPKIRFHTTTSICITGAKADIQLNDSNIDMYCNIQVKPDDILDVGKVSEHGSRIYILFSGGIQTPKYLNSRSTFTLGKFGGHCGRPLFAGDSLPLLKTTTCPNTNLPKEHLPSIGQKWTIRVLLGPHTAPEFFTLEDVETILKTSWKVHFNSDRTGVRLIGPQPKWAREDGGEAGLHPSNIHDNAYAIGAMDFTGDQPVLLGPDGPSLGGFVCPITIIKADLWKMGQLRSDDEIIFEPVSYQTSLDISKQHEAFIETLKAAPEPKTYQALSITSPILYESEQSPKLIIRQSGDRAILCEFGALELDFDLRIHVHFFMQALKSLYATDLLECTPGIRSIQIQFNAALVCREDMIERVKEIHTQVITQTPSSFDSRIIHLPLAWDDPSTQLAIDKYVNSVRPDAPWCCPNNIEFIRRINGLKSVQDVKNIVYDANYLVMGLGDVYLGAPVAVPIDPRHRLVTTKYNPARTWTPENAVGIGGTYLCIYGMEGPGGYQFVGRTLPVWNRFKKTPAFPEPYLLRFFDQISFFEVSPDQLLEYREAFIHGEYNIKIEKTKFDVQDYHNFIDKNSDSCVAFKKHQSDSFQAEKQRWIDQGVFSFDPSTVMTSEEDTIIPPEATPITSPVSGAVWKVISEEQSQVKEDDQVIILESMKMEMEVKAPCDGKIEKIFIKPGQTVQAGQHLGYVL